jgi:hypothetical protein
MMAAVEVPHPEERALARVSKDEKERHSFMVRDAAPRLLTIRPSTTKFA